MATTPARHPPTVTIDAKVVIANCAKEPDKDARAKAEIERYAKEGWQFVAPGVIVAECLDVFCRKRAAGTLTTVEHAQAVQSLEVRLSAVRPPPNGEAALIRRAEQIRGTYGCSHSADGIDLALAEELAGMGAGELVTSDQTLERQAQASAPTVVVHGLIP